MRTKRRKVERYPPATWLRKHISPYLYGERVGDEVYPAKNKEELVRFYNHMGYGVRLRNQDFRYHAGRKLTFYFQGNSEGATHTLAMIDIDVQKSQGLGSTEGAVAFAEYLKEHYLPNLYWEMSTGGRGVHAYVVVEKVGVSARHVNNSLKCLQAWLERRARGFDVEKVEVMGHCPQVVLEYDREVGRRQIKAMKFGSFAKLPRELDTRFAELRKTTTINWLALRNLPEVDFAPKPAEPVTPSPPARLPPNPIRVTTRKKGKKTGGSVSGKNVSEEDLEALPRYERLAERYLGGRALRAGRHLVTPRDFAIGFLLLRFFKRNPNGDGTLPQARVQRLWEALSEAGDVDRPWNHHRWKVIRDSMSGWGLLEWADSRYQPGYFLGERWHPGVASKWSITDEFLEVLERGGASFGGTATKVISCYPRPRRVWGLLTPPHRRLDRYLAWAHEELAYQMAA